MKLSRTAAFRNLIVGEQQSEIVWGAYQSDRNRSRVVVGTDFLSFDTEGESSCSPIACCYRRAKQGTSLIVDLSLPSLADMLLPMVLLIPTNSASISATTVVLTEKTERCAYLVLLVLSRPVSLPLTLSLMMLLML